VAIIATSFVSASSYPNFKAAAIKRTRIAAEATEAATTPRE
jgi:hypothetical protein